MAKIVACIAYHGGTGKTFISANLAALLAMKGLRVCAVDIDLFHPGIITLFRSDLAPTQFTLSDCIWGKCDVIQTIIDVSPRIEGNPPGKLFLCPTSVRARDIARVLREGYDVGLLFDALHRLVVELQFDVLVLNTWPGLHEEMLLAMDTATDLLLVMRRDAQDFAGTPMITAIARKLGASRMGVVLNQVPIFPGLELGELKKLVETACNCPVISVIPYMADVIALATSGIIVDRYPDHTFTKNLRDVAAFLSF